MSVKKSDTPAQYDDVLAYLEHHGFTFNPMLVKECLQALTQTLMDIEVSQMLAASHYERNMTRRSYRNGYRQTVWNTSMGDIDLRIPKLRRGTYYPDQLLHDPHISEVLVHLILVSILQGVDEEHVAKTLSTLDWVALTPNEVHQVCDVIRLHLERFDRQTESLKDDSVTTDYLPINYRRQLLLRHIRNTSGQVPRANIEDTLQQERKFWQDFTRRLIQAGFIGETHQAMLSGINPYASLQLNDGHTLHYLDFAQDIHPLYEERYQRVA